MVSNKRKNFIVRNEGFTCEACSFVSDPAKATCRNHCPNCLTSKHVDGNIPGDRASVCLGLMPTIRIEGSDIDKLDLVQCCTTCGLIRHNKIARDDNREKVLEVIKKAS